jgi:hypothetical protein
MELESLRSRLRAPLPPRLFRPVIERLEGEGRVVREDALVRLVGHRVTLGKGQSDLADRVHRALRSGDLTPPDRKQLETDLGTPPARLADVLRVLEQRGDVVRIAVDLYYDRAALDDARRRVVDFLGERPEITVAEFRDLIAASRKYAVALRSTRPERDHAPCRRCAEAPQMGSARRSGRTAGINPPHPRWRRISTQRRTRCLHCDGTPRCRPS